MFEIHQRKLRSRLILWLLIIVLFSVIPTKNWASPMCSFAVSVSKFQLSENEPRKHYRSVAEAFQGRNQSYPFIIFALATEQAIIGTASQYLCDENKIGQPIIININVVELGITASNVELGRLKSAQIGVRGSYAEVSINRASQTVDATVIWNPRRMLRDQLTLDGWDFDEELPLLPFLEELYQDSINAYVNDLIFRFPESESENIASQFNPKIPKDLFGLMSTTIQSTRGPFNGFVHSNVVTMTEASVAGYTAMTKATIDEAFASDNSKQIIGIGDIDRPEVQRLYQENAWNLFDKVTSEKKQKE